MDLFPSPEACWWWPACGRVEAPEHVSPGKKACVASGRVSSGKSQGVATSDRVSVWAWRPSFVGGRETFVRL
jgi:hypothetical protein